MMKRLYAALLSGVFLLPSLRAAEEQPMVEIPDSLVSPEPEMEQSDFALRLFQQQVRQTQGNVTCSPSSLVSVLRMLQIGARGETAAGLSALKLPLPLLRATIDMQEAEALFVDDKLAPVLKNFARRHDVVTVPMVSDAQQAARRVNDWVSGRTGGRIPELVTPEGLQAGSDAPGLLAVNAIAMQGKWLFPFSEQETVTEDFYCADGSTPHVQMMHQDACWSVAQGVDWLAVKLPYQISDWSGKPVCMVAILPRGDARQFVDSLTVSQFADICEALQQKRDVEIHLGFPRFELRVEPLSFKSVLAACGVGNIFQPGADFSGFADVPMYVSDVRQSCYVKVDEQGTTAAAATSAQVVVWTSLPELPPQIIFNRPFIWAILQPEHPDLPYFMGLYEHP